MDIKTQWKKMAEKAGKKAENHFILADNARINNQKEEEEEQLKKQMNELEKQYVYMKNVNLNICSYIDKYAEYPAT
jgi:hypothetical protein